VVAATAHDLHADAALKALRCHDTLTVWKLDRLGRNLRHLINTVHDLTKRGIGFKVLTGHGASIDTTTPAGKLIFGIFAALAEFEKELISERTKAGLASARARGRKGGAPFKMTPAKLRLALAAMGQPKTRVSDLCRDLGVTRQTLYRHVSPKVLCARTGENFHRFGNYVINPDRMPEPFEQHLGFLLSPVST
jgi:DNA invertase Pin-like site-specific DNA recombinase